MKIIDEAMLDRFRAASRCEFCGQRTQNGADPAHISARGLGSGKRVDLACNLVSLCRGCHCAQGFRDGPSLEELWAIAAKREGMSVKECKQRVWDAQRRSAK